MSDQSPDLWKALTDGLKDGVQQAGKTDAGDTASGDVMKTVADQLLIAGAQAANPNDAPPPLPASAPAASPASKKQKLRQVFLQALFPQRQEQAADADAPPKHEITFGEAVWRTIALGLLGGLTPTDPDEKPFIHRLQERLVNAAKRIKILGGNVELSAKSQYSEVIDQLQDAIAKAVPDPRHGGIASEHDIAMAVERLTRQRIFELYNEPLVSGVEPSPEERALGEQLYKLLPSRSQVELRRQLLIKVTEAQRDVQAGNLRDELAISYKALFENIGALKDQNVEKIFVRTPLQTYGAMTPTERKATRNVRWSLTYEGLFIAGIGDEDDVKIPYSNFLDKSEQMIVNWSATGDVIRDRLGFFRDRVEPATKRILGGTLRIVRTGDGHIHAEIPVERPDELMATIMTIAKAKKNLEYLEGLMREHAVNQSPSRLREIDPKMVMLAMPDPTALEFPPPQFKLSPDRMAKVRDLDGEQKAVDAWEREIDSQAEEIEREYLQSETRVDSYENARLSEAAKERAKDYYRAKADEEKKKLTETLERAQEVMRQRRQNRKINPDGPVPSTSP